MSFSQRTPSTAWEAVPLPTQPPVVIWGWFKPAQAPNSVVLQLPPELWKSGVPADQLTLIAMITAAGLDTLSACTLYGQPLPLDSQLEIWLEAHLPPPQAENDRQLILWADPVAEPQPAPQPVIETPVVQPVPQAASAAIPPASGLIPMMMNPAPTDPMMSNPAAGTGELLPGENPAPYFELIDFYWTNILYIESDVRRARQQLDQSTSKLNSLNRDLNFEELYAADSADKQHWQDARRWLRDASASLSKSIKEIDVGLTSAAGQRNRFLEIYEQYVKPRIPFPGLKQSAVEFEMLHKSAKNVLQGAQAALHKGASDGERRANAILARIAQKIRQKSNQTRGKNA